MPTHTATLATLSCPCGTCTEHDAVHATGCYRPVATEPTTGRYAAMSAYQVERTVAALVAQYAIEDAARRVRFASLAL